MQIPASLSTRLEYQHESLMEIIADLSDEQIRRQIMTGKWSVFENIVHLQTYQHTFINRIKQMLENNNPLFPRYTAESDPLFLDNCSKSTREIIQDLVIMREELATQILSFTPSDLARTATHTVFGHMTVVQWLNFFLLHEAHHLLTIFKLAAELKKG